MTYGRPGVYINEALLPAPVAEVGTANAAGAALGAFAKGPEEVTLVTSWYDFVKKFGGFNESYPATFGIYQFFQNGGTDLYVRRVLGAGAAAATVALPSVTVDVDVATVTAKNKGTDGNNLRIQVTKAGSVANLYNLTVWQEAAVSELGTNDNNATNDIAVEVFSNIKFDPTSSDYVQTVVNSNSRYISIVVDTEVSAAPALQDVANVLPLTGGLDGDLVIGDDFAALLPTDGSSEFDLVSRPLVIFAPEIFATFTLNVDVVDAEAEGGDVQQALIDWASSTNGFAVVDTPAGLDVAGGLAYVDTLTASTQAAAYYPNYYVTDPLSRSRGSLRKVGPAGGVVGSYLATDKVAGPFKSPAGVSTPVRGAVSLERSFTPKDLDSLNTGEYLSGETTVYGKPLNAIRNVPGAGIVIMGGRTLLNDGTANMYVNTRRSLIYIKKRLQDLTLFAVFQNNDYRLWKQLANTIGVFLNEYRNQGGLRGETPSSAYYVKVDAENNPPASIASGVVNIEVGVALEYPAEFVVITLSQIAGN